MSAEPGPGIDENTLDFILEWTRRGPERQGEVADALDHKAIQSFTVASVVLGLAGVSDLSGAPRAAVGLLIAAVCVYVIVALSAIGATWTRRYRAIDHAGDMWPESWADDVMAIKHSLVDDIVSAHKENAQVLHGKVRLVRLAMAATAVEVGLVGATLVSLASA